MKKITTLCLVVGLMIACTEKESVERQQPVITADVPSVVYRGKSYSADDEIILRAVTSTSVTIQFDFENYVRLFDNQNDLQDFLKTSYDGKYAKGIERLLTSSEGQTSVDIQDVDLGSYKKPSKPQSGSARTLNTIYDF